MKIFFTPDGAFEKPIEFKWLWQALSHAEENQETGVVTVTYEKSNHETVIEDVARYRMGVRVREGTTPVPEGRIIK